MNVQWLPGLADYGETLRLQEELVRRACADPAREDELLLLQHRPVYTIGRTRDQSSLNARAMLPHPVFEINRGGQATYHGPGQLTGYPITNLNRMGQDLHLYVRGLEGVLIDACSRFGVEAHVRDGLVGIWVEDRKLASIGVGVRKWIAMHGFALNVMRESLPPFLSITPCGLQGVRMTCLEAEIPDRVVCQGKNLIKDFGNLFGLLWQRWCQCIRKQYQQHDDDPV